MGFTNRFSTLLKQRLNALLDMYEDPKEGQAQQKTDESKVEKEEQPVVAE